MLPRSKHWHLIDYIIIRKRDRQLSAAQTTVSSENKTQATHPTKRRPQGVKARKRLNVNKMEKDTIKQSFVITLEERLESIVLDNQDVETAWGLLAQQ